VKNRFNTSLRQRFLAEQGYAYRIVDADELLYGKPELEQ
jgi:hypothetical protein